MRPQSLGQRQIERSARTCAGERSRDRWQGALPFPPDICARWLPDGRRCGMERQARNPRRSDRNLEKPETPAPRPVLAVNEAKPLNPLPTPDPVHGG
jgi:hypothetical protein